MAVVFNLYGDVSSYDDDFEVYISSKVRHMLRTIYDGVGIIPAFYPKIYTANSQIELDDYQSQLNDYMATDDEFLMSDFKWTAEIQKNQLGEYIIVFFKDELPQKNLTFEVNQMINLVNEKPKSIGVSTKIGIQANEDNGIVLNNSIPNNKLLYIGTEKPIEEEIILNPFLPNQSTYNIITGLNTKLSSNLYSITDIVCDTATIAISKDGIFAIKINEDDSYLYIVVKIARNGFYPSITNHTQHNDIGLNGQIINNDLRLKHDNININTKYFINISSNRRLETRGK